MAACESAIKLLPGSMRRIKAEMHVIRGYAYLDNEQIGPALAEFQRATALDSRNREASGGATQAELITNENDHNAMMIAMGGTVKSIASAINPRSPRVMAATIS